MAKSKKKSSLSRIFASSAVRALAVVVLTIASGAVVLPRIFAETAFEPAGSVTNLVANPGNGSGYSVALNWNGSTPNDYVVKKINGSNVNTVRSTQTYYAFHDLNCNITFKFEVFAAQKSGAAASPVRSVNGKATCPLATLANPTVSGNSITARWSNANFASAYTLRYRAVGGGYVSVGPSSSTSHVINGSCDTTYEFSVSASAGGQTGPATAVKTARTAACPVVVTPPNTPSTPSPQSPTPQSPTPQAPVVGSNGSTRTPTRTQAASNGGTPSVPTPAPATPENFSASVASNKIVELTWNDVSGADHYIVSRSTDQQNWSQIAETKNTYYDDESGEFSKTYYYQLQAVGADGQISGTTYAEIATEAFEASSSKIESDDRKVVITVPDGAFETEYSCTLGVDRTSAKVPAGQSSILGPYDLLCVIMKLGTSAEGYKDLGVKMTDGKTWSTVKNISYNQNKQEIGFKLAKSQSFGIFGVKQKSSVWIIFLIFFLILIVGGVVFFILRRRRNQDDYGNYPASSLATTPASGSSLASPSAEEEFRQAVAQPDCSHLDMAQQVIPSSAGCLECEQQGTKWNSLRICLICGHVGCSDDSDQQHALKHFSDTGHPLIYEYGNLDGNSIGWCYTDQTYI